MKSAKTDTLFAWRFSLLCMLTLLIAFWGTFNAPLQALGNDSTRQSAYLFDNARVLFSGNPNLAAAEVLQRSGKRTVVLPDSWDITQQDFEGHGWYQIEFRLNPGKPRPDALFIPKAIMNAHAYLNGHWIGGHGPLHGEIARHWNYPYLFQFSPELLNQNNNVLLIQVAGYKNYRSGLGRVWLGPSELLEPLYASSYRWQVTGSMLATLVAFVSGLMLLVFARVFREQEGFLFFSLAVIIFALRNTGYFLNWTPLPHAQWGQLVHSLHAWFACLYGLFLIQYMGLKWIWIRKALWVYAIGVTVLTFTTGSQEILQFTFWLLLPIIPVIFVLNLMLLGQSWQRKNFEGAILGCSSLLFVLLSIRDLSTMLGALPVESVLLSQYTGILLFFSACWIIFRRYRALLEDLETSNESLNSELAVREQQLFRQFNLLRKIEQQRTQDDERRRIMQDIHDGVGSSLVSALNLSETRPLEQEEMRDVLQECLDDLRMAIDSLDPQSDDLLALLGNFRWRYERRLKASGVTLLWTVTDIPKLEGYSSRDLFDLLRIVQEVFANSLKHAKASKIELSVRWDAANNKVLLNISDDGIGMPTNTLGRGRGLAHMKIRAKAIRIELYTGVGVGERGVAVFMAIPRMRRR
ncbi:ATP-binding protein [Limnobacter sp.]|uniref:sensor histidine kinase n=1 Tax=Limnobacter sp. TaxID=2003368 RepID=UPI002736C130|nr:ATP-binding protein [Limnobacter sp.]MDP3187272.1 ATP-binding protein [Limnobacter sp.]